MHEVEIAHGKMHTDGAAKTGEAHDGHYFNQAPAEFRTTGHKEQKTSDRAESTAKAGTIM